MLYNYRSLSEGSYDSPAECLRSYLLGREPSSTRGPEQSHSGLLGRVRQRVKAVSQVEGPVYRTGSVIPTGGAGHANEDASGLIEQVTELAIALNEWEGQGIGSSTAKTGRSLIQYLRANHLTDVDYLVGRYGRLERTVEVVKALLIDPTEMNLAKVESLAHYLTGWIGDCKHEWHTLTSEDGSIELHDCPCGAGFYTYQGDDRWLAVRG